MTKMSDLYILVESTYSTYSKSSIIFQNMAGKISNRMNGLRPCKKMSTSTTENRRQKEDNLAVIFMGIVIVFLVCHFPRIFLSLHEMLVIRKTMACSRVGYYSFPLWALLFAQFSHILLVLNSSMNSVIYCMVSSKYREQALKYLHIVKSSCGRICIFIPLRRAIIWCQHLCTKSDHETSQNINVSKYLCLSFSILYLVLLNA